MLRIVVLGCFANFIILFVTQLWVFYFGEVIVLFVVIVHFCGLFPFMFNFCKEEFRRREELGRLEIRNLIVVTFRELNFFHL